MRYFSREDAEQGLAAMLEAAQREPVTIRNDEHDVAVIVSPQEYERLRALNSSEFLEFCDRVGRDAVANGLTEEELCKLLNDE
jgi:hypothetical protein